MGSIVGTRCAICGWRIRKEGRKGGRTAVASARYLEYYLSFLFPLCDLFIVLVGSCRGSGVLKLV